MKTLVFTPFLIIISSCIAHKEIKYPNEIKQVIKSSLKEKNQALYILERHDAIKINKISILFNVKDSTFSINNTIKKNKITCYPNDFDHDKLLLKKYSTINAMNKITDTTDCDDCDFFIIYRIKKTSLFRYNIDTIYKGHGIE
jgi:hypothetical protein